MRSPKLDAVTARSSYYRYYAGYSEGFVEDIFSDLKIGHDSGTILDPWNGAGTTTNTAARRGLTALGLDLNPAAVIIGRSRLVGTDVASSLRPLVEKICDSARSDRVVGANDMLSKWFGPSTTATLRSLERATYRLLVDHSLPRHVPRKYSEDNFDYSALAALFYVALFNVVRKAVTRYVPSNPTWIKNPTGRRLGIDEASIYEMYIATIEEMSTTTTAPRQLELTEEFDPSNVDVRVGSSHQLPFENCSIEAVISSPPYCTRLDYVKATLPELAILGLTDSDVRALRDNMIGTPTINSSYELHDEHELGPSVAMFLESVRRHDSYAARSYYLKYYRQYFAGLSLSLAEIHRVLQPGRAAVLVVQDSYFKDVHLDLPAFLGDMAINRNWSTWERVDFTVPRTMASIHPGSRRYRKNFRATESAVILTK